MTIPRDGFPFDLSPLGWALSCAGGDDYSYEARGMLPVLDDELDTLACTCARRGLELFADDTGLHVELLS